MQTSSCSPSGSTKSQIRLLFGTPMGAAQSREDQRLSSLHSGAMLDTGNFVLMGYSDSDYVWETFRNPTDTILPTQILELDAQMFSRLTELNYTKGRFELQFSNGDLELYPLAWPTESPYRSYYSSQTSNPDPLQSGHQVVYNESGDIYIAKGNGEIVQLDWQNQNQVLTDYYHRATLDFYGVFTQYAHTKNSSAEQGWSVVSYIPPNICTAILSDIGSGACGFNSYCTSVNGRPSCNCPNGYSHMDADNEFSDCKLNLKQGCGVDEGLGDPEDVFEFWEQQNLDWPTGDFERLDFYNETQCKDSCLHDCLCDVAILFNSTCWKKKLPLANGRLVSDFNGTALVKMKKFSPQPPADEGNKKKAGGNLVLGSLGAGLVLCILLLFVVSLYAFLKLKKTSKNTIKDSTFLETNLRMFSYKELEEATKGFKEQYLGEGSFGAVYKGELKFGSRNVVAAIKKLHKLAKDSEKEFQTELRAIAITHHKNLVRLLGFCIEKDHRLLVYEFMSNGTLADFLFGLPKPDWNQRISIGLGIASGLLYLHEECETRIIHCDIKPQNILLDERFNPRICDFGLAKLLQYNQTRTKTMARGTRGYVAPEWFKNAAVTAKVDVYSFGIVLLELICCRRGVEKEVKEEERAILSDWAYECYEKGRVEELVEGEVVMGDMGRLESWLKIALWCIQEDPCTRPTMKNVLQMLEGSLQVPLPPCPF